MSSDIPFFPEDICDECGATGAYDIMGDCFCPRCFNDAMEEEESEDEIDNTKRT